MKYFPSYRQSKIIIKEIFVTNKHEKSWFLFLLPNNTQSHHLVFFDLQNSFIGTWSCSCQITSWFSWHFSFQTLLWVTSNSIHISFFKFFIELICKVETGMWAYMGVMGRNCTTILLSQRTIHQQTQLFCGLMVVQAALALMPLFMNMVGNITTRFRYSFFILFYIVWIFVF